MLAPALIEKIENEIYTKAQRASVEPTRSKLEQLARDYYRTLVDGDQEERAHMPQTTAQRLRDAPRGNIHYVQELKQALALGDYNYIESDLDLIADENWLNLVAGSPMDQEFRQHLMRAAVEAAQRWSEHDRGDFTGKPSDPLLVAPAGPAPEIEAGPTRRAKTGETMLELYEIYSRFKSGKIKLETLAQRKKSVIRFAEYVGKDRNLKTLSKADARAWREQLYKFPKHAAQTQGLIGLDFKSAIKANENLNRPTISLSRVISMMGELETFFGWLTTEDYISKNIFAGLRPEQTRGEQKVFPFDATAMQTIFNSPIYIGCAGQRNIVELTTRDKVLIRDWRFWLPLIAAYSGARQGEIAQLEVADIREDQGIWFFDITNNGEGKSLKTAYSKRRIPIHSQIKTLGFLEYVAVQRAEGATLVFPKIKRDPKGQFNYVSKFFQKYLTRIGVKTKGDPTHNFHSFRHGFIDQLRRGYTEDQIKPLISHSGKSTTGGYGIEESLALPIRQGMIETVDYDGLKLVGIPKFEN